MKSLNLFNIAFAPKEKEKLGEEYEPTGSFSTRIIFPIGGIKGSQKRKDNGNDIPKVLDKNFTTLLYYQTIRAGNRVGVVFGL